jgi:hypothetical protein
MLEPNAHEAFDKCYTTNNMVSSSVHIVFILTFHHVNSAEILCVKNLVCDILTYGRLSGPVHH